MILIIIIIIIIIIIKKEKDREAERGTECARESVRERAINTYLHIYRVRKAEREKDYVCKRE